MAECPGISNDSNKVYYKEVIMKKEGKDWTEYYAVLMNSSIIFNRKDLKTGTIIPNNYTTVDVLPKTICAYGEKTCYRFPFWVQTGKSKYNFKCETKLQRFKWMYAIRLCALGKPPENIPNFIPTQNTAGKPRSRTLSNSKRTTSSMNGSVRVPASGKISVRKKAENTDVSSSDMKNVISSNPKYESEFLTKQTIHNGKHNLSSGARVETNDNGKSKSVKWDLRSVISYVNKSITLDSSNIGKKKVEHSMKKNKKNEQLENNVLENTYFHDTNRNPTQPRKSSMHSDDLEISDLEQIDYLSNKPQMDVNNELENKEQGKRQTKNTSLISPKSTVLIKTNNIDQWIVEGYDHEIIDYAYVELENLAKIPKEHDELESYPSVQQRRSSVISYRTDGDIEKFARSQDSLVHTGVITTDRFGHFHMHSPRGLAKNHRRRPSIRIQSLKNMERAQSMTSLRQFHSPRQTPPRRESSAPPLRFSRHKDMADSTNEIP